MFFEFFVFWIFLFFSAVLVSGRQVQNAFIDCLESFSEHQKHWVTAIVFPFCFSALSKIHDGRQMPFSWKKRHFVVYWNSSVLNASTDGLEIVREFYKCFVAAPLLLFLPLSDIRQLGWKFMGFFFCTLQFWGNNSRLPWLIALKILGNQQPFWTKNGSRFSMPQFQAIFFFCLWKKNGGGGDL